MNLEPPKLRRATFDDYEGMAAVEAACGLKTKPRDEWMRLWTDNPAYEDGWPIGWVLEDGRQGTVGTVSNIPLEYEFQGKPLRVATGRGWAVRSEYRGYALLLLNELFEQKQVPLVISTSVNANAAPAFEALGCVRVPVGAWDRSALWITNYRGFARSLAAARGWRAAAFLSYPLAGALWAADLASGSELRNGSSNISFYNGFDGRFDDFWDRLRQRRSGQLLARRDRRALEWHFGPALRNGKAWVLTCGDAYSVFCRKDNPRHKLTRMRLVDFQSLSDGNEALGPMLGWALRRCRAEGIHMLENIGMDLAAPHRRKLPSWLYVYRANCPELAAALSRPEAWAPTAYDGDASL